MVKILTQNVTCILGKFLFDYFIFFNSWQKQFSKTHVFTQWINKKINDHLLDMLRTEIIFVHHKTIC